MDITTIEEELKIGQVVPKRLAMISDYLASISSTLMDRQLELQLTEAEYFEALRGFHKSDKATVNAWRLNKSGQEQLQIETTQRKIKVLLSTIGRHLRVADNEAHNRY